MSCLSQLIQMSLLHNFVAVLSNINATLTSISHLFRFFSWKDTPDHQGSESLHIAVLTEIFLFPYSHWQEQSQTKSRMVSWELSTIVFTLQSGKWPSAASQSSSSGWWLAPGYEHSTNGNSRNFPRYRYEWNHFFSLLLWALLLVWR